MTTNLDDLARSLTTGAAPFAFCGIGISRGGPPRFYTACHPGITADEDSIFRAASISKIVTSAAFEGAANGVGLYRPYAEAAGPILDIDLQHPQFPDRPVTLGMLMTHTSGLTDAGGYLFDSAIDDGWQAESRFGPHAPGTFFEYSNLGYILLAAVAERLSGMRFDALVHDALQSNDLIGRFNWAGASLEECVRSFPTYRRDGARFVPMIDAAQPTSGDVGPDYELGRHTARFSPQGGMRTSLRSMLGLSVVGRGVPRAPMWRRSDGEGCYLNGLFEDYGAGEQILHSPPFYPRPLVGHFGNAYGFKGGTWWDMEADICFAYALNGAAMGDEGDDLCAAELAVFDAVAQVP